MRAVLLLLLAMGLCLAIAYALDVVMGVYSLTKAALRSVADSLGVGTSFPGFPSIADPLAMTCLLVVFSGSMLLAVVLIAHMIRGRSE